MSKFMAGKSGLSIETLDRLGELLKLKVTADVVDKPSRASGRKEK
jgi:hypothetical protein